MVNFMKTLFKKLGTAFSIALFTFCNSYSSFAAPGTLAQSPLFLGTAVEPNIFFTYDDSGSMGWETIVQDGTAGYTTSGGRPIVRNFTIEYFAPSWESDWNVMPPNDLEAGTWVFRNHNGNKNYYNPDVDYAPWEGVDLIGAPLYEEYDATNVPEDPYSGNPDTLDLTEWFDYYLYPPGVTNGSTLFANSYYIPTYYIWPDNEVDGVIETTDNFTEVEILPGNAPFTSPVESIVRSYAEEMQNFTNWFVYYRTREFAAKAGMGAVINNSQSVRMGMDAFHGELIQNLSSMEDDTNKYNLLNDFYAEDSGGGTPAHEALVRVGERFKDTDGSTILLEADGGACQQNFNIFMSDGFWNSYVNPGVGNADSSASADGGFDGDATESNDGGNYEDDWSNTVADVAMYYYETDLSAYPDQVPVPDQSSYVDGAEIPDHQHLVTYTIGFGLNGTLDSSLDPATAAGFAWPDPMDTEDEERVDDLWHAAYNSRGLFLSAENPQELESSLDTALADIAAQTAVSSAAAVTSSLLTQGSTVYLAEFNSEGWHGTIDAFGLTYNVTETNKTVTLNATADWSAAEELANKNISNRVILTYNSGGVEFDWSNLTTAMQNDLKTNASGGTDSDLIGQNRLDYIRGDHSNEGTGSNEFRERATLTSGNQSRLGDMVHSGPVYVGKPNVGWPDDFPVSNPSTPYSDFVAAQETSPRTSMVYVGANDGMLHGFDSDSGEELLAYIPSNLFSTDSNKGLHYLTEQDYSHQYYVDLTPSISDVFINGSWHTVLVGGQRAGGQGYFALDVTDPDDFDATNAANIVMWEFTHEDLGYTYSRPQIGMMNDGTWVAIFGNGYNHTGTSATGGMAQLFIVDIETGSLIKTISTGAGSTSARNGLATPALADLDLNGTIDRAYAGDLEGNMWAFDLSGSSSSSWDLAYAGPLFTTDGPEPITTKPILSFHPTQGTIKEPNGNANEPNVMVFFGSGQYLVEADLVSGADNYFHGVWDKGNANLSRGDLVDQTISTDTYNGVEYRFLSENGVDYNDSTVFGWNIDLPDGGERIITNPVVRGEIVYFNSSVPTDDPCGTGGYGYRFGVDLATGGAPDTPVFDINGDGFVDENDTNATGAIPSAAYLDSLPTDPTVTEEDVIQDGEVYDLQDLPSPKTGRFSWQELLQ